MMDAIWILAAFLPLLTEMLSTEKGLYIGTFELFGFTLVIETFRNV